ncbi:MAG TPA: NAD(P)H dehydrogenase, partial [Actinomycetales bacterium]|nr:NAD(P)H dehydrogenase [Actinomycetales bacterium]
KLANKAYAAYTSSQTAHGGQETTLQAMHQMVMHFGGVLVPPGYTDELKFADGNPYGVSHITGPENQNELEQATIDALEHMTKRVIEMGAKLAG